MNTMTTTVANSSLDRLTAALTGFDTFADLVGTHPNYRPTIRAYESDDQRYIVLADAFDAYMKAHGSDRRAWRGSQEPPQRTAVLSCRLTSTCPHGKPSSRCCGNPEWLRVIHTINRPHKTDSALPIGEPIACYDWWAGGWCEEYPEYRVILGDDRTNYVQALTPAAADALRDAVAKVTGRGGCDPR